jgi:hypothetical protein
MFRPEQIQILQKSTITEFCGAEPMKLSVSAPKAIPAVRVGQICNMSRDDTAF